MKERPVQFDVKQHTVLSVCRNVNYVSWTHETGKRVSVFVHSAAVSHWTSTRRHSDAPWRRMQFTLQRWALLIKKGLCANKYVHIQLPLCWCQNGDNCTIGLCSKLVCYVIAISRWSEYPRPTTCLETQHSQKTQHYSLSSWIKCKWNANKVMYFERRHESKRTKSHDSR
jgi:hypothetical protein